MGTVQSVIYRKTDVLKMRAKIAWVRIVQIDHHPICGFKLVGTFDKPESRGNKGRDVMADSMQDAAGCVAGMASLVTKLNAKAPPTCRVLLRR